MNRVVAIFFLLSISNIFSQSKQVYKEQTIGKNVFEIDCSIRALEVENDSTCWFAGSKNKFGYTNDFGKTWKENVIKYDTFNFEFRSISVTTNSVFIFSVGSPALLFKIDKKTLNYKLVYKETEEKAFYDSMQFWDDENGIAVGDPTANCMSIVLTKDGGNSWKKIACENLPLAVEGEAAFAASNTNISLVDQKAFIATGGKEANVLVGTDYGKSWKKYKTPIIQGEKMTGIFSVNNLSVDTAIIAGGDWSAKQKTDNAMAITKDGGNSWQLIENNPGYISCVQFIPKTKSLVASSTTGIYYSEDLAESWVKISDEGYYSLRISKNGEYLYFSGKNKLMNVDIATLLSN
ncbi:MAG: Ycf48-like protein [Crocinitomicaceae bacterium]|nr:MAG: Ycf48-like protein [Crocinitomicaceae bacterium]